MSAARAAGAHGSTVPVPGSEMSEMVGETTLSAVLGDLARTAVRDVPVQGVLDRLVDRVVEVLPVDGAAVTLLPSGTTAPHIAASSSSALHFERLQAESGQGPWWLACETGDVVAVPDLSADDRFPLFAPAAVTAGLAAVFTVPLQDDGGRLGALDLYREAPGPLDAQDLAAAQTLAEVASAYLLNAKEREDAERAAEELRARSMYDELTGLPNQALMRQRLEHATRRAERSGTYAGVLFIDLDRFKLVNDTHGHEVGDQLLRAVASRLSSIVRPGDTLARMYGDEFVFLCEDLSSADEVEAIAARVVKAFTTPFEVTEGDRLHLMVSASVGLAYAGPGDEASQQMLADADRAMYQAKRQGGASHRLVDLRRGGEARARTKLRRDLHDAFDEDRFDLSYQPIVHTADGRLTAVEALLRWSDPGRGAVPARTMIDIAEQNGLIHELGAWVLRHACEDRERWLRQHQLPGLDLSVNVSVSELLAPGFVAGVQTILTDTGMDPAALILEMTEGILIHGADRALTVLTDLKSLGVRLALDDFGTGYSGLSYLRYLPVDIVKIDQGFVADIGIEPAGTAIVDAVTNLAHALNLSVTAEGIETPAQRDGVAAVGCDQAQGFLYAPPMPDSELAALLAASPGRRVHLPRDPLDGKPAAAIG
jgi:diguanylate cyclase (GGDEF)-like protein